MNISSDVIDILLSQPGLDNIIQPGKKTFALKPADFTGDPEIGRS